MKTRTITFFVTLLIAAVPLGMLWKENTSLRARIAVKSMAAPPPAAGETAKPASRGSFLGSRSDKLAAQKSEGGTINWSSLLEDPDPVRRAARFYTFVNNMTPESALAAAESLERMHNRNALSDDQWQHFFRAWGGVDGKAVLDFLNASEDNSAVRWKNREAALTGWASLDLAGAQAWLANYASTGGYRFFAEDLFNAVSQCMGLTDPDAARDYLVAQTVAGHVTPVQAAEWIARDWNGVDAYGKAETLLAQLPADGSHQIIRTGLLCHLVDEYRSKESFDLVTRFQSELDSYDLKYLATRVADDDSSKAMAWLDSLDRVSPANKTIARANVVSSWAARDPAAAGSWLLEAHGRGEAAPEITTSYATAIVGIDPAAAIAWTQTIPDEAMRHKTLLEMAENRAASSDTEALELLKAAGLTDREISEANLFPAVVDRRIPTAQARGSITRCAMVRPD